MSGIPYLTLRPLLLPVRPSEHTKCPEYQTMPILGPGLLGDGPRLVSTADILAAYDSQLRRLVPSVVPVGHEYQQLGPLLWVTGQRRGFIESARDLGVEGEMPDRLIAGQRDYFAIRGKPSNGRPGHMTSQLILRPASARRGSCRRTARRSWWVSLALFAGLWGGSTLPAWRGRGIYKALVATRAQVANASGVRYLQVDASADSDPILRRSGFRAITTTTFVWTPPGDGGSRAT